VEASAREQERGGAGWKRRTRREIFSYGEEELRHDERAAGGAAAAAACDGEGKGLAAQRERGEARGSGGDWSLGFLGFLPCFPLES
jgi:hypothetical protein